MSDTPAVMSGRTFAVLALLVALGRSAAATPIALDEQRATYMIFNDVGGDVETSTWIDRGSILATYRAIEDGFLAAHPDDSHFIVMYTTFPLTDAAAFYQSIENQTTGIGYQYHTDVTLPPTETFDDSPQSMVMGFLHMNQWQSYLGDGGAPDDEAISLVFGQELGHAWLAQVHFDDGRGNSDLMLGRDRAHWSFYLDSGGSPVEGHEWTDNGDGTFTATPTTRYRFSDLDLYLMGLMPASQVQPWFLVENPTNCIDSARPDMSCAPREGHQFRAAQYRVTGTRRDITIDHVIATEGPRNPAYPDATRDFTVSFIVVKRPSHQLSEAQKAQIDAVVTRSVEMFVEQTRGFGTLTNRTVGTVTPRPDAGVPGDGPAGGSDGGVPDGGGGAPDGAPGGGAGDAGGAAGGAAGGGGAGAGTGGTTGGGALAPKGDDGGCATAAVGGRRSAVGVGVGLLLLLVALRRRALAALALVAVAGAAQAAPIRFVEQRATYMIFDDVDGVVENGSWYNRADFLAGFRPVEEGFLASHADDSQFLVIYTTFPLQGAAAFFQAVENHIEGIGYRTIADLDPVIPAPVFDDTPSSQLQGFMHMNHWQSYVADTGLLDEERISLVFGQELGHAWLAFVRFDDGTGESDAMLGRDRAHWSFYLNSGGSPVEGHEWIDNGDGTFTAVKRDRYQFSDLDLYLMGLIPPTMVRPWFIVENPTNCVDSALENMACAPREGHQFRADQYRVTGTRRDVTIDDVIAAEGPRVPAWPDAPSRFDISFLLVKRPADTLSEQQKVLIDSVVERSIEMWVAQTRGFGSIVNRTAGEVGPAPDAGAPPDAPPMAAPDGGVVGPQPDGAAAAPDAARVADAGGAATAPTRGSDGGCSAAASGGQRPAILGLLLAVVALVRRSGARSRAGGRPGSAS